jgi:pyridoxal phosphate enzyme (YggS family)
MTADGIAERLARVRDEIARAAAANGRAGRVLLLAVSKGHPPEALRTAYAAGQRDFGENYVQELEQKAEALADLRDLRLHLIGHLQRNKAKVVVKRVSAVHSVDSPELAAELDRRAVGGEVPAERRAFGDDPRLPVFAEINIANEAQKSGCAPAAAGALLDAIEQARSLRLTGLMCVPPFSDDPAASVPHFEALVRLRDAHGGVKRLPELSMGMTADFAEAIVAGSTIVRVGTAIFGARPPKAARGG